jgi:putative phage-type endonuclease
MGCREIKHQPDRNTYIGGSTAGAILGVSPYSTPVQLWERYTGRAEPEVFDKMRDRIMKRGQRLEPVIIEMVIDKLQEQGHEVELLARNKRYVDEEHEFLGCEIDAEFLLDGEHINVDAKSASGFMRSKWGEEETDQIPIEYAAQFMHGMMITGKRRTLVAALIGLDDVAIYWLDRDDETIAGMRAKEVQFWTEHVLADVPPDPMVFDDLSILFPMDNGKVVEATEDIANLVAQHKDISERVRMLTEHRNELQYRICEFMSPHALLAYKGKQICSWKGQNSEKFLEKQFKEAHPDIASKFTKHDVMRVLRHSKGR